MPDRYFRRQVFEYPLAGRRHRKVAALAFCARITLPRLEPPHQSDGRAKRQRHLLMPAANAQHRLRCLLDYFKHTGERAGRITVPGMTLATEDNVGRLKRLDAFEGDGMIRLSQYFGAFAQCDRGRSAIRVG